MHIRILDLDGAIVSQRDLVSKYAAEIFPLQDWGPAIRLVCSFPRFRGFMGVLNGLKDTRVDRPIVTFYGSGDFHHVSLALLQRQQQPFNLLVLDNHPDWMQGVPCLHCGTWLAHAARLPFVRRIFHVGGDVDFDNSYRWLAPWHDLENQKIVVFPAHRRYTRGRWERLSTTSVLVAPQLPFIGDRMLAALAPFASELSRYPLYISLDKDVMLARDSIVNWDSGHLTLDQVVTLIDMFLHLAKGQIAGIDVLGDWSPVEARGWFRRTLARSEHPRLTLDPAAAAARNEATNLTLIECVGKALANHDKRKWHSPSAQLMGDAG